jgi:hypothetical protein
VSLVLSPLVVLCLATGGMFAQTPALTITSQAPAAGAPEGRPWAGNHYWRALAHAAIYCVVGIMIVSSVDAASRYRLALRPAQLG